MAARPVRFRISDFGFRIRSNPPPIRNPQSAIRNLVPLLLTLALLLAGRPARADGPQPLVLLPSTGGVGFAIDIENITYTKTDPSALEGTGDMVFHVLGGGPAKITGLHFQNVAANTNGQVIGAGLKLEKDVGSPNLVGGIGFTVAAGTVITAIPDPNTPAHSTANFTGGKVTLTLPFKSDSGTPLAVSSPSTVTLQADGTFHFDLQSVTLSGPAKDAISLGGFSLYVGSGNTGVNPELKLDHPGLTGQSLGLTLSLPQVTIGTPIPNLLTEDRSPLKFTAKNLVLDENGVKTFDSAGLDQSACVPLPYRLASGAVKGLAITAPLGQPIRLAQPPGFVITVTDGSLGQYDRSRSPIPTSISLTADVQFPTSYVTADGTNPATIHGAKLDLSGNGFVVQAPADGALKLQFAGGFQLTNLGNVVVDFSSQQSTTLTGAPVAVTAPQWEGVYIGSATLTFPPGFLGSGAPPSVPITGFYVDSGGVTGTIGSNQLNGSVTVAGYPVTFTSGSIEFARNKIVAGSLAAKLQVNLLSVQGPVTVNVAVSQAGLSSVSVDAQQDIGKDGDPLRARIDSGAFRIDNGTGQLSVSGALILGSLPPFPDLKDSALSFKELGVDTTGKIKLTSAELQLAEPARLPLGVLVAEVSRVGYNDATGEVSLDGGVLFPDYLPVSGSVTLQNLKINTRTHGISIDGVSIDDASILNVLYVKHAGLAHASNGEWSGGIDFGLGFTGGGIGGIQGAFKIRDDSWFVAAGLTLPPPGVVLAPAPLSIYGFHGAVGHNIGLKKIPAENENDVFTDSSQGQLHDWLFAAGVTIGTSPDNGFTAHGDVTLSLVLSPFLVDLNGKVYLLSPIGQDSEDRTGQLDMRYDAQQSRFTASVAAKFIYPTSSVKALEADGGMDLMFHTADDAHLWLGWPYTDPDGQHTHAIRITTFVPGTGIPLFEAGGGVGLTFDNDPKVPRRLEAGFFVTESFLGGLLEGTLDGRLLCGIDPSNDLIVYGRVSASGKVDFKVVALHADADLEGYLAWNNASHRVYDPSWGIAGDFHGSIDTFLGSVDLPSIHFALPDGADNVLDVVRR